MITTLDRRFCQIRGGSSVASLLRNDLILKTHSTDRTTTELTIELTTELTIELTTELTTESTIEKMPMAYEELIFFELR